MPPPIIGGGIVVSTLGNDLLRLAQLVSPYSHLQHKRPNSICRSRQRQSRLFNQCPLLTKEVTMVAIAKKVVELFVRGSDRYPLPMFWAI